MSQSQNRIFNSLVSCVQKSHENKNLEGLLFFFVFAGFFSSFSRTQNFDLSLFLMFSGMSEPTREQYIYVLTVARCLCKQSKRFRACSAPDVNASQSF